MVLSEGAGRLESGGWLPGWSAAGWPAAAPGSAAPSSSRPVLRCSTRRSAAGGQVSAVQQRLLCRGQGAGAPSFFPSSHRRLPSLPTSTRAHSLEVGTRHNQSKVGWGCAPKMDLRGWNLKMVTRLRAQEAPGARMKVGGWGRGCPPIFMLGVGARGMGAHPGGSAGHWCAAPGPRSAAPCPCALCPGCRSCTRRRRPAPAGPAGSC